jgi:hypothetical protein
MVKKYINKSKEISKIKILNSHACFPQFSGCREAVSQFCVFVSWGEIIDLLSVSLAFNFVKIFLLKSKLCSKSKVKVNVLIEVIN